MDSLVEKLFNESQSKSIIHLLQDNDVRLLIKQEISKKLLDNNYIIDSIPLEQLICIFSLSTFADSENECCRVAGIIHWGIQQTDIFPMITKHHGKELAYRCLISLGLFKKHLVRQQERHGAPSILFYREVGIQSFGNIGMKDIGNHFYKWENFIGEFSV